MKWEYLRAEDYCDSVRDGTHDTPKQTNSGYRLVTGKHIKDGQILINEAYFISENDYYSINERSLVEKWDVIMSMIGTVGESAVVKDEPLYAIKNVALFKCGRNELKSKWLHYYLSSPSGQASIKGNQNGSSQQFVSLGLLRSMVIPITELRYMKKVVEILSAYDDLIENNRKQTILLEEAAQRLYKEWFVYLQFPGWETTPIVDGLPEGWKKGIINDTLDILYGKDHKKIPDGEIPVYGSSGLMRKCNQQLYCGESVLVPRKGSLNNVIYVDEAFWTVDTMFYSRIKLEYGAKYLYFLLSSYDFYAMNIGAAVPSMTTSILGNINITIPEKNVLMAYDIVVSPLFNQIKVLKKQNDSLNAARDALLPKLMNGEIEV